jgi:hypothetical protein
MKFTIVKKKRERSVFFHEETRLFYKLWVKNWTQSLVVEEAISRGFYDDETCSALHSLIYDETGPRGYILKEGVSFNSWGDLRDKTSINQRKVFFKSFIDNSILANGTFHDFYPNNIVLIDNKLSFIDLDAFRSFSLIFDRKKEDFERFDIEAWWKPHETARRDVTNQLPKYMKKCLHLKPVAINNKKSFESIKRALL